MTVKQILSFFLILGGLYALGVGPARSADTYRMRIVVFGDSITSGKRLLPEETFAARLKRRLQAAGYDIEVIDMSEQDDTTSTAIGRVESVLNQSPDMVILAMGQNDIERGIDPTIIYNNLYQILYRLVKNQADVNSGIYVLIAGIKASLQTEYSYRARIETNFKLVADSLAVSLYPFVLQGVAGVPEMSMADGVHPNAGGVNVMVENLLPMIDTLLRYRLAHLAEINAQLQQRRSDGPAQY